MSVCGLSRAEWASSSPSNLIPSPSPPSPRVPARKAWYFMRRKLAIGRRDSTTWHTLPVPISVVRLPESARPLYVWFSKVLTVRHFQPEAPFQYTETNKLWELIPVGGPGHDVLSSFTSAFMVLGGSGITFGLSTIDELIREAENSVGKTRLIELVWVIQDPSKLTTFSHTARIKPGANTSHLASSIASLFASGISKFPRSRGPSLSPHGSGDANQRSLHSGVAHPGEHPGITAEYCPCSRATKPQSDAGPTG